MDIVEIYNIHYLCFMGVIYKITSPTDKIYIGKTYNLKQRIASHKHAAKKGKNIILHNSIRKYGWDAHKLEIIEELPDEMLNEREIYWVAEFKSYYYENPNGMNMTKGGEGQRSTWMHKIELRKYFSEKFSGEGNPFYGKKHSKEFLERKSKEVSEYNKKNGIKIPEWGVEKGRQKVMVPVLKYSLQGDFICEYDSLAAAAKDNNVNHTSIFNTCNDYQTQTNNCIYRYKKNDSIPLKISVDRVCYKNSKRPVYLLNKELRVCEVYSDAQEAANDLKIPKTTINRVALYNNLRPIRKGHIFIYKDLYEKLNLKTPVISGT